MQKHLKKFKLRPVSPSCISSWLDSYRDPRHEKWAQHYLLDEKTVQDDLSEARMAFGKEIHERIAQDPKFLPSVPRYDVFEDTINVSYGRILLTGKLDTLRADLRAFADFKTTQSRKWWTQAKCDTSVQFLFYFLLLYLKFDIQPSDILCKIAVIYVDEKENIRKLSKDKVKIFTVKHTMVDLVNFLIDFKKIHASMCEFAKEYKI